MARRFKSKDYSLIKDWDVNPISGKVTVTKLDGNSKSLDSDDDVFKFMSEKSKVGLIQENRECFEKNNLHNWSVFFIFSNSTFLFYGY